MYPGIFYVSTSTNISSKCTKTLKKSGSSEEWLSGYRCNEGLCYAIRIGQS